LGLISKLMVGLKLLVHCCPGMVTFFSKTPDGIEQEDQQRQPAAARNKRIFFNETRLCKNNMCRRSTTRKLADLRQNANVCPLDEPPVAVQGFLSFHKPAHYNTFKTCSFAFSSSSFISTTHCWMVESYAFEPVVLISRPISWRIKDSFLPLPSSCPSRMDLK